MKLIRVSYGRKDTKPEDKEYHQEGDSRVGTIAEFRKEFPDEEFLIFEGEELMNTIKAGGLE